MAKLERKAFMTYIDSTFDLFSLTKKWCLVGKDLEELTVELNPDLETIKNILGENTVKDNGYEVSATADPFYANPTDPLYPSIKDIAMNRYTHDKCKTYILEVIVKDTSDTKHEAYLEQVVIKPQSYGGDTSGFNIPYNVNYDGNRIKGYVTFDDNKQPTFVEGEID